MSDKQRKFHDALDDALDRPIAYNPAFRRITGSTVAGIFLSQAWYWSKRHKEDDGWFYKIGKEWEEETGLSRSEQETARRHCLRVEVMEEKLKGVPATMYYRVIKPKVYELLGIQIAELPQTENEDIPQTSLDDVPQFAGVQQCDGNSNINKETETPPTTPPINPPPSPKKKKDIVDGYIETQIKPTQIRQAFADFFKLTPNWEAKYNRQFLEWSVETKITPEQVQTAADVWRSDKRFNWSIPTLKGIQEHWLELIGDKSNASSNSKSSSKPTPEEDARLREFGKRIMEQRRAQANV